MDITPSGALRRLRGERWGVNSKDLELTISPVNTIRSGDRVLTRSTTLDMNVVSDPYVPVCMSEIWTILYPSNRAGRSDLEISTSLTSILKRLIKAPHHIHANVKKPTNAATTDMARILFRLKRHGIRLIKSINTNKYLGRYTDKNVYNIHITDNSTSLSPLLRGMRSAHASTTYNIMEIHKCSLLQNLLRKRVFRHLYM